MGRADLPHHQIDGALMYLDFFPVDEQSVIRLGHMAPQRTTVPIILGRHRPRSLPDIMRQSRPDEDHIEMTRVIREVNPLARIWLAVDPAHAGPAQKTGDSG